MTDTTNGDAECRKKDWAGHLHSFVLIWGIPSAIMLLALLFEPMLRAAVWAVVLTWMGGACIANARQCGRTHCYYTGPFFLLMAVIVLAYVIGALPLGPYGWLIIALTTIFGNGIIWWGSERLLGAFRQRI